jgi:hypothetical protein
LAKKKSDLPYTTTHALHVAAIEGYEAAGEIEDPADRSREMRQWWDRLRKLPEQLETEERVQRVEEAADRLENLGAARGEHDPDPGSTETCGADPVRQNEVC